MSKIVPFPPKVKTEQYFGGCPKCGKATFLNVGRHHYLTCNEHKVYWYIGANIFSGWRDETEADWLRNQSILAGRREVRPILPDDPDADPSWGKYEVIDFSALPVG